MVEKKTVSGRFNHHQLILHQAGKLAEMLRQSPEYNQYMAARQKLEADEDNSNILAELRQQELAMQMSSMFEPAAATHLRRGERVRGTAGPDRRRRGACGTYGQQPLAELNALPSGWFRAIITRLQFLLSLHISL